MQIIHGGITAAQGFSASGVACKIKKRKKDLAVVASNPPAQAAGSFTTNLVKAAPVVWDQQVIASGTPVSSIVINSGNANACTGAQGWEDAQAMAAMTASHLGVAAESVLVCSTGVIGVPLPMDAVTNGIADACSSLGNDEEHAQSACQAIMTTDTFCKEIAVEVMVDGNPVRIGGMAKGSGMIHPNLATMLCFITTDGGVSASDLQSLLGTTVVDTYNMISVDGDTSTNDTVLALANGCSDVALAPDEPGWSFFADAFSFVNAYLAKQIVRDGEGAGKFIEVEVQGAVSNEDARVLAKAVITSNLVKTAFFGADANWGRILCAMGYSGAQFNPNAVDLSFSSSVGNISVVSDGCPIAFDEHLAKQILSEQDVQVHVQLHEGDACATAWGCDLSYEYVRINGDYRS